MQIMVEMTKKAEESQKRYEVAMNKANERQEHLVKQLLVQQTKKQLRSSTLSTSSEAEIPFYSWGVRCQGRQLAAKAEGEGVSGTDAVEFDNDAWKELGASAVKAAKIVSAIRSTKGGRRPTKRPSSTLGGKQCCTIR